MARRKKRLRSTNYSVIKSLNEVNTKVAQPSNMPVYMVLILFIASLMIGFVWQKVKMVQLVGEIEELKNQELQLVEINEKEKVQKLNLTNDTRIMKIAKDELKLTFPEYEVVNVPPDYKTNKKLVEEIIE